MALTSRGTSWRATVPTLTLTGPATLNTGQVGDYVLTVTGGPGIKAGMNVAAGPGTISQVTAAPSVCAAVTITWGHGALASSGVVSLAGA